MKRCVGVYDQLAVCAQLGGLHRPRSTSAVRAWRCGLPSVLPSAVVVRDSDDRNLRRSSRWRLFLKGRGWQLNVVATNGLGSPTRPQGSAGDRKPGPFRRALAPSSIVYPLSSSSDPPSVTWVACQPI